MSREANEEQEQEQEPELEMFSHLPLDLVLRIMDFMPSPVLFDSRFCKAAHERALLTLSHRPFFVFQSSISSLCYLLPLDSPSTPLPCSFKLAKPSFQLALASGNLLCLRRQYPSMLDICVCNIFRRWKVTLAPIVHPCLAPRLLRRVFLEDCSVDSLSVIGFHVQPIIGGHAEHGQQAFHPEYRVFVASNLFLRVYDSCTQQWSSSAHFPSYCSSQIGRNRNPFSIPTSTPPQGFVTADGNLILTFSATTHILFKCEDQSFSDICFPFHPSMEIAGFPATACVDPSFNLEICLPHVEGESRSSARRGLKLREVCRSEHGLPCDYTFRVYDEWYFDGFHHEHQYTRHLFYSQCFAYQGKVYALLVESEEMHCSKECNTRQQGANVEWHSISLGDVRTILHNDDAGFSCYHNFPRRSPRRLTLYSGCVDTINWTIRVRKEADTTEFHEHFGKEGDRILDYETTSWSVAGEALHAWLGTMVQGWEPSGSS